MGVSANTVLCGNAAAAEFCMRPERAHASCLNHETDPQNFGISAPEIRAKSGFHFQTFCASCGSVRTHIFSERLSTLVSKRRISMNWRAFGVALYFTGSAPVYENSTEAVAPAVTLTVDFTGPYRSCHAMMV